MLDPGQPAPDFELVDHEGRSVRLSDYEGQHVVLYFFPRAGTPGCTTEACGFRDRFEAYEAHDVAVLGVSNDAVEDLAEFAAEHDLPFRLLSDPDGAVASEYGTYGTAEVRGEVYEIAFRNTYLIDPDGTIAAVYEDVTPEGHAEEILATL